MVSLFIQLKVGYIGASPDGLVHDPASHDPSGILEIKCPYTTRDVSPEEACQDRDFHCTLEDGHIKLKKTHIYFHQVQLQLYVCSDLCTWCDFCVFTTKGCMVCRQYLDSEWVKECIPKLHSYFEECMLPEIVHKNLKPSYFL